MENEVSENPYQPPATDASALPSQATPASDTSPSIYLSEGCLVTHSNVRLPQRCVVTNVATPAIIEAKHEPTWVPRVVWWLIFMGGLLGLILYIALHKKCVLYYSVVPAVRAQRMRRILLAVAAFVLCLIAIPVSIVFEALELVPLAFLGSFLSFIGILLAARGRLRVVRVEGDRYWITGFGPEFFEELRGDLTGDYACEL